MSSVPGGIQEEGEVLAGLLWKTSKLQFWVDRGEPGGSGGHSSLESGCEWITMEVLSCGERNCGNEVWHVCKCVFPAAETEVWGGRRKGSGEQVQNSLSQGARVRWFLVHLPLLGKPGC